MRRLTALLGILVILAYPSLVAATAYGSLTYQTHWHPPGYADTALCVQPGIVDTARNYSQSVTKNYVGSGSCSGSNRALPSGWIRTQVAGFRSGALCGYSGWYYSNVQTSSWQIWIQMCSNPSGTQVFHTRGYGGGWYGDGYVGGAGVTSPSQNY